MNLYYYRDLKRKIYRAHLLSLGFPNLDNSNKDNLYDLLDKEEKSGSLDWIHAQ